MKLVPPGGLRQTVSLEKQMSVKVRHGICFKTYKGTVRRLKSHTTDWETRGSNEGSTSTRWVVYPLNHANTIDIYDGIVKSLVYFHTLRKRDAARRCEETQISCVCPLMYALLISSQARRLLGHLLLNLRPEHLEQNLCTYLYTRPIVRLSGHKSMTPTLWERWRTITNSAFVLRSLELKWKIIFK